MALIIDDYKYVFIRFSCKINSKNGEKKSLLWKKSIRGLPTTVEPQMHVGRRIKCGQQSDAYDNY